MKNKNKHKYLKHFIINLLIIFFATSLIFREDSLASQFSIEHIPIKKSENKEKNYKEGEILVKFKDKEKLNQKIENINQGQEQRNLAKVNKEIGDTKIVLIKSENKKTEELLKEFENDENIEIAEPNYKREFAYVPDDSYFFYQWAHRNTGQIVNGTAGTSDADADITEAWDIESALSDEIIVAVIDSGVRHTHTDLTYNMWDGSVCFDKDNVLVSGGCPNHGWDYENGDDDPDDDNGHGTFVASIIGSTTDNSSGIAGLSRYNKLKIMALRFDLYVDTEIDAINFAKNNGAKVINGSFSGSGYSALEKSAIDNFPGVFAAAAGNGGDDYIGDNNETTPQYPCNYTSTNIICVGASDQDDVITDFSNYGTTSVDLTAPGSNIVGYSYDASGGWTYYVGDGTSFASPIVAGAAGLLYSQDNALTPTENKSLILDYVDIIPSLSTKVVTSGRLNINTSLNALLGDSLPPQRSGGQPSGSLSSGTTATTISLTTNENATCKYSTNSGIAYDSMTSTFSTTGTTSHSQSVSGLSDGNSYNYYVRCMDGLGNKNTSDFAISFSVNNISVKPVYRFYSQNNKSHFFTISTTEKDRIIATYPETEWRYEGVAYYVPETSTGNKPVYRFYSPSNKSHFFTASSTEKNRIIATYPETEWRYEGIAYYVPTTSTGNRPVYRFYSPSNKSHFFTVSGSEKNRIISTYPETEWRYEGISYYVPN